MRKDGVSHEDITAVGIGSWKTVEYNRDDRQKLILIFSGLATTLYFSIPLDSHANWPTTMTQVAHCETLIVRAKMVLPRQLPRVETAGSREGAG